MTFPMRPICQGSHTVRTRMVRPIAGSSAERPWNHESLALSRTTTKAPPRAWCCPWYHICSTHGHECEPFRARCCARPSQCARHTGYSLTNCTYIRGMYVGATNAAWVGRCELTTNFSTWDISERSEVSITGPRALVILRLELQRHAQLHE